MEINAFPDFAQSGEGVEKEVVRGFWEGVLGVVNLVWFGGKGGGGGGGDGDEDGEKGGKEYEEGKDEKEEEEKDEEKEEEEKEDEEKKKINNETETDQRNWGMRCILDVDLGRR